MKKFYFFFLFSIWTLWAAEPIGKVVLAEGEVSAIDKEKTERPLKKDSPVFEKDTIVVSEDARAEIHLTDGSALALRPETEYQITSYSYEKSPTKDNYLGNLLKGGFRTVSGAIGKENPEKYEINTPNAIIGLRGTLVDGSYKDNTLYVFVDQGKAEVRNGAGSIMIGTGLAQYAVVSRYNALPQTMMSRPPQLTPYHFFAPPVHH